MESCFENTGTADVRAMTEMRYRIGMKKTWIWLGIYLTAGFLGLFNYCQGYGKLSVSLFLFAYSIYLVVSPYFRIRKSLKAEAAFHNGKSPVNTARFSENIRIENTSASRTWKYEHLVEVYSWKYSYGLRFTDDMVLLLDRANFTKGTFEEFKQFLREKRPDLTIPE